MNLELFIARKLLRGDGDGAVSVPIVRIALVGIALGVCVMLLSIFVITGFKQEITDKLSGFAAHVSIVGYSSENSAENGGIRVSDTLYSQIRGVKEVKNAYVYVMKPAILKSKDEIHGVMLRGVDSLYNKSFFVQNLKAGEVPDFRGSEISNEVLISSAMADLLGLKVGDRVFAHFVQDPPRVRSLVVKGVYDTGFKEYDDVVAICDMRHLQRLNGWEREWVTGVAVQLHDMVLTAEVEESFDALLPWEDSDCFYRIEALQDSVPQIFDWLALLNMNVWIILVLIVVVAGFNMVSGLLILILDKTSLIGILKALGCRDVKLRRLFLYVSVGLVSRGMLWGNVLALLLAGIQWWFEPVRLDAAVYYMDKVPVHLNLWYVLLLDVGVLVVSVVMLIIPTMLISRIRPIKAIQFK